MPAGPNLEYSILPLGELIYDSEHGFMGRESIMNYLWVTFVSSALGLVVLLVKY
jgi:hypothetical protein